MYFQLALPWYHPPSPTFFFSLLYFTPSPPLSIPPQILALESIPICGNGHCEVAELTPTSPYHCPQDCPISPLPCPHPPHTHPCNAAQGGLCDHAAGVCVCNTGFTGDTCSTCAQGFVKSVGGTCSWQGGLPADLLGVGWEESGVEGGALGAFGYFASEG